MRTVAPLDGALAHIARYSSRHSEAIVTENKQAATQITRSVDAACVYVNVSTAFTDGGQFGFGAEVGISTQKPTPAGPMGLPELRPTSISSRATDKSANLKSRYDKKPQNGRKNNNP